MALLSTIGALSSKAWGFARAIAAVGADTLWNYVTLLLSSTTPSGGLTINSDLSSNNLLLTPNGVPYNSVNNPFQAGYYSNYIPGSSNYLSYSRPALGTVFTVEFWAYPTVAGNNSYYVTCASGVADFAIGYNGTTFSAAATTGGWAIGASSNPILNQWNHIALVRANTTANQFFLYLNGSLVGTGTSSTTYSAQTQYIMGGPSLTTQLGYISNLRIVNGTAVYTGSTYTVPTTPLTAITNTIFLSCQSASFIDNSTNNLAITRTGSPTISQNQPFTYTTPTTYGSEYFNGSTDYLSTPNSTPLNLSSGSWTIEAWVYPLNYTNFDVIVAKRNSTLKSYKFQILQTSCYLAFYTGSSYNSTTAVPLNTWSHVAAVYNGTTLTLYLNGTSVYSSALTITEQNIPLNIGYDGVSNYFPGYISNLRIVKGTAVYTSNFTPSTTPLTAITNTSLLSLQNNIPATNNGFVDSSTLLNPITRSGTPTQGSFAPFGTLWSNYFGGTGNYLQTSSTPISTSLSTFTIEAWVYMTATPVGTFGTVIGDMQATISGSNYWSFGVNSSNQIAFYWYSGTGNNVTGSTTMSLNTWYHIAISVNTNTISMYVNGVAQTLTGTTTLSNRSGTLTYLVSGQYNGATSGLFTGYISNLRIVTGTALYTASFTPPTTPLTAISGTSLLTCQTNRFQDTSTNNATITATGTPKVQTFSPFLPSTAYSTAVQGGSAYFNGTNSYMTVPYSQSINLSTGAPNWTVELWVYTNSLASQQMLMVKDYIFGTNFPRYGGYINTNGTVSWYASDGIANQASTTVTALTTGTWYHLAFVRNGTTVTTYINGVSSATVTISTAMTDNGGPLYIGAYSTPGGYFNGYMSNIRILNGTALYTTAFTPPTAPLAPITNTALLLNTANAGSIDYSTINDLVTVSNATVSTNNIKYGTGSLYFNGSSYLQAPTNPTYTFGSGNWTIETWVYLNALGSNQHIIDFRNSGVATAVVPTIYISNTNFPTFWTNGSARITGSSALTTATWYHIAVVKNNGTTTLYLNGTSTGTPYTDANTYTSGRVSVGVQGDSAANYLNGYLSDLRVTNGVARYTANFTPPTTALPNY
jgi:hypothetical protein